MRDNELAERIAERNSQTSDEAGLDDEYAQDFDDPDPDPEYGQPPPEPKRLHPREEREATLEAIAERHESARARELIAEEDRRVDELAEAQELLDREEDERLQKEVDEEAERDAYRLDEDNPAADVLERLREDEVDIDEIDLRKVEARAGGSGGDPMDYRTYLGAAREVKKRQRAVEKNPSLKHIFDSEDERFKIEQNRRNEIFDEIDEGEFQQEISELHTSHLNRDQIDYLLDREDPEIARDPHYRAMAFKVYDQLVASGEPVERWSTMRKALELIDTRDAIEGLAEARGQRYVTCD